MQNSEIKKAPLLFKPLDWPETRTPTEKHGTIQFGDPQKPQIEAKRQWILHFQCYDMHMLWCFVGLTGLQESPGKRARSWWAHDRCPSLNPESSCGSGRGSQTYDLTNWPSLGLGLQLLLYSMAHSEELADGVSLARLPVISSTTQPQLGSRDSWNFSWGCAFKARKLLLYIILSYPFFLISFSSSLVVTTSTDSRAPMRFQQRANQVDIENIFLSSL